MNGAAVAGAAVQGGFGILGSGLNYLFNKRLAEQQNQYNIDMWNMQNEYNSPQAQMQRFQEAGLNPNLIYGQGSNGNAIHAPEMVVPQAPAVDKQAQEIGKLFNIANLQLLGAEINKANAEANSAQSDAEIKDVAARKSWAEYAALGEMGEKYRFNARTGQFEYNDTGGTWIEGNSDYQDQGRAILMEKLLKYYPFGKIPYQVNLLEHQKRFLVPQINMRNFDWKHYPTTFFIDRANKGVPGFLYGVNQWMRENLGFGF